MDKHAKKQLKRQAKALKRSLKRSLKEAGKAARKHQLEPVALDKKRLKSMTDQLVAQALELPPAQARVISLRPMNQDPMAFARRPFKKSPCKRCPALQGGLCACAIKKQKRAA
ncbi:hypothetical protein FCL40_13510 [Ferrimonas sediminicola]|uniref:Uncharacterized protein n=1 Tax=Ferrimonas sediminicola TaxID=2569538 RepID=A0A4U1BBI4_9GAMM|nr:hypothetical protein [Ferrimonas sediminicola]TKB48141.1 hypothetical protein FCL40_13510 [Ferrimonas sediminicola]